MLKRIDWLTVFLYALLVFFGWINIYSTTLSDTSISIFNTSTLYGKQLFFIGVSVIAILGILFVDTHFFERFGSVFYVAGLVLLLGLFVFGKKIGGATSWYDLGFMNLQPSEFVKVASALALAKYLSDIQTDIKNRKHQFYAILIILVPVLLVFPQPDPGSALIFFALFFVLFREGLPIYFLGLALILITLFVFTLIFGTIWVAIGLSLIHI